MRLCFEISLWPTKMNTWMEWGFALHNRTGQTTLRRFDVGELESTIVFCCSESKYMDHVLERRLSIFNHSVAQFYWTFMQFILFLCSTGCPRIDSAWLSIQSDSVMCRWQSRLESPWKIPGNDVCCGCNSENEKKIFFTHYGRIDKCAYIIRRTGPKSSLVLSRWCVYAFVCFWQAKQQHPALNGWKSSLNLKSWENPSDDILCIENMDRH